MTSRAAAVPRARAHASRARPRHAHAGADDRRLELEAPRCSPGGIDFSGRLAPAPSPRAEWKRNHHAQFPTPGPRRPADAPVSRRSRSPVPRQSARRLADRGAHRRRGRSRPVRHQAPRRPTTRRALGAHRDRTRRRGLRSPQADALLLHPGARHSRRFPRARSAGDCPGGHPGRHQHRRPAAAGRVGQRAHRLLAAQMVALAYGR
jgi:hypothetical protein